jgi:hypothetical protein
MSGPPPRDVSVDIAELVLVRRPGEPLDALMGPLTHELAARGVPEAEVAAHEIIDGIVSQGAS